jgi:hypothetical protein
MPFNVLQKSRPVLLHHGNPTHMPTPAYGDPFAPVRNFMTSNAPESQKKEFMISFITPRVASLILPYSFLTQESAIFDSEDRGSTL